MAQGIKINWTEEMIKDLGVLSDRDVADKYNIHRINVIRERNKRGIKPAFEQARRIEHKFIDGVEYKWCSSGHWGLVTNFYERNNGTDDKLSRYCFECSKKISKEARQSEEHRLYMKEYKKQWNKKRNPNYVPYDERVDRFPENISELMLKYNDRELSKQLNISSSSVKRKREELNIESRRDIEFKEDYEKVKHLLGWVYDKVIGKMFNINPRRIENIRRIYNLPSTKGTKIIDGEECRKCRNCKQYKPLNEFFNNRKNPKGKTYTCKKCTIEIVSYKRKQRKGWDNNQKIIIDTVFDRVCYWCGITEEEHKKQFGINLSDEHFIADNNGGEYKIPNIYPACRVCNSSKSDLDCYEFAIRKFGKIKGLEKYNNLIRLLKQTEKLYLETLQVETEKELDSTNGLLPDDE